MSSYKDAVLAANKEVQVVITAGDDVWLPSQQHSAVAAIGHYAAFTLAHRDGREVAVGGQQLGRCVNDDKGEGLAALFFGVATSEQETVQAFNQLLENNAILRERVESLEGRMDSVEASVRASPKAETPKAKPPKAELQPN
jgi:hypothetical protein